MLLITAFAAPGQSVAIENNLPPYEQSLRRLSAVVGALMYLDPLCNGSKPQVWHDQMAAILEAENADDTRQRQLTDRFNKSYRTFADTYSQCNAQAKKITKIYHTEGQNLLTNLKLRHTR
ncbi:TIGR02301 family protein [Cohaesibacter sp. ES.047]|uniref:TIGR02301 family protein n=1 Tax=Cohaesibacter sp. ES.047 TaxID=1798205 RepID=UPI000BC0E545|nr:TIGR02301 family protein [Cohaesibacter sp. ES.047]SNY93761.1 TIGR02301 family protein [Cohaesibacter sp. ES.047]